MSKSITIIKWLKSEELAIKEFSKYNLEVSVKNIDLLMNISKQFNDFILNNSKHIFHLRNIDLDDIQNLTIDSNKVISYEKFYCLKKMKILKYNNCNQWRCLSKNLMIIFLKFKELQYVEIYEKGLIKILLI